MDHGVISIITHASEPSLFVTDDLTAKAQVLAIAVVIEIRRSNAKLVGNVSHERRHGCKV